MRDYSFFIARWFARRLGKREGRDKSQFIVCQMLIGLGIFLFPSLWAVPAVLTLWLFLRQMFRPGPIRAFIVLFLIFFVVIESAILWHMTRANLFPAVLTGTETMVIPGAAVRSDEPGEVLRDRLERAVPILKEHPGMAVIVSGGRSPEDRQSEAAVMRAYLVEAGIALERIHEEPLARDTIGNFEQAAGLIRSRGLSREIAVVTSDYHGFRSQVLARTAGLEPKSIPTVTPDRWLFRSLVREAASWVKVIVIYGLALK